MEDFTQVSGSKVEAFCRDRGDLRGEDLRSALQQVVTDWKQSTTELTFAGTGEFLDLESLEKKYADRPSQLESIKEKTYKFWDHIRGCYLYEDVRYTRTAQKGDGEDLPTIKGPAAEKADCGSREHQLPDRQGPE